MNISNTVQQPPVYYKAKTDAPLETAGFAECLHRAIAKVDLLQIRFAWANLMYCVVGFLEQQYNYWAGSQICIFTPSL